MPSNAAAQLHEIAARMKLMVDGQALKIQMTRSIREAAEPLKAPVRAAAMAQFPHTGGLNAHVANQQISVSVTTGMRSGGVRLKTHNSDTKWGEEGFVRHPVFGTWREGMPDQQIPRAAGWWSKTLQAASPSVTPAVLAVMERVAAEIMTGTAL